MAPAPNEIDYPQRIKETVLTFAAGDLQKTLDAFKNQLQLGMKSDIF